MMGPKTVAEIREELRQRLSKNGKDPIDWLRECIAEKPTPKDSRVLESLLEFLQDVPKKSKPKRKKAAPAKKR